ncbi:MAG: hypothetical protein QOE71_53 [Pseudonocardiales bacterium]|jgi:transcriptional regulator with GAF, ATPase, and Fis domain|nr:hypothetical protein [Pseudonocardiales bacterium]
MTELPRVDIAQWFAVLAKDFTSQPDTDTTASRILDLLVKASGCDWAAIAHLKDHGGLSFDYSTDASLIAQVADIAMTTDQGIASEALHTRGAIRCQDLASESRWPEYRTRMMAETPIRSAVAYCLSLDDVVHGALMMYSSHPFYFTDEVCEFAAVYADHAAIALANARDHDKSANLEMALLSNREIGVAMGILMARHAVSQQQAFDLLRSVSQTTHRKLRDVAADVTLTGELPEWRRLRPA